MEEIETLKSALSRDFEPFWQFVQEFRWRAQEKFKWKPQEVIIFKEKSQEKAKSSRFTSSFGSNSMSRDVNCQNGLEIWLISLKIKMQFIHQTIILRTIRYCCSPKRCRPNSMSSSKMIDLRRTIRSDLFKCWLKIVTHNNQLIIPLNRIIHINRH